MSNKPNYIDIDVQNWKKTFSSTLNSLMTENNISFNKLANIIGIDEKSLRNYVNVDIVTVPNVITLQKLAVYFEVSTDYLMSGKNNSIEYSGATITALGTIIKDFNVELRPNKENPNCITLDINDKILSLMIREMYIQKNNKNYSNVISELIKNFGHMKLYNNHLIDAGTFISTIEHEFVYHDLEAFIWRNSENNSLAMDECTFEEVEERYDEWEKMTMKQRQEWWEDYCCRKVNEKLDEEDYDNEIIK